MTTQSKTRYVSVKTFKNTIGKACIIHDCSTSAKVTAVNKHGGVRMPIALCLEHAEERGIIDAS